MYDVKNSKQVIEEEKGSMRCDCISDRAYFRQIQYESMFEFKALHIPIENIVRWKNV